MGGGGAAAPWTPGSPCSNGSGTHCHGYCIRGVGGGGGRGGGSCNPLDLLVPMALEPTAMVTISGGWGGGEELQHPGPLDPLVPMALVPTAMVTVSGRKLQSPGLPCSNGSGTHCHGYYMFPNANVSGMDKKKT